MPLIPLVVRPGINREGTLYSNKGGWYFIDKMRFRHGSPEKIGGWQKYSSTQLLGVARSILITADLTGITNDAIGTNLKYYVVHAGAVNDVTPLRDTNSLGANPFASTSGLSIITVTDTANGSVADDFVTFSGATTFAGIAAVTLNANYQILSTPTANTYTIDVGTIANSTTSGGGSGVVAEYEIHVGLASATNGPGWGAGFWSGVQGWGEAADVTAPGAAIRLWTQCTYGEDILICPRGGEIYIWDATNPTDRAVAISASASAVDVPVSVTEIFISETSRQVFAFGCNPIGSATLDPMFIRFAPFENVYDWLPVEDNEAGSLRLSQGSKIITAAQSNKEIVVFTDVALYSLQNSGYPFYWGATLLSTGQSIIGPNAKATVNQTIYWMGNSNFFFYDGQTKTLPCAIQDYVFSSMDLTQTDKVFAGVCSSFGEIWWFYPSEDGNGECDSYVIFDYEDGVWSYGTMPRTVWADSGIETYPIGVGFDGYMYNQEYGENDGSTNPPSAIYSYIQSSPLELDPAGNAFAFANRIIPDVTFRPGHTSTSTPMVTMIFYPQDYPGAAEKTGSDSEISGNGVTVPIEEFTEQAWFRLRGRSMMLRVECDMLDVAYRLGVQRIDARPDGFR